MHKTRQDELHRYLKLIPGFYFAGMYYAYACVLVYCPPPAGMRYTIDGYRFLYSAPFLKVGVLLCTRQTLHNVHYVCTLRATGNSNVLQTITYMPGE